MLRLPTDSGELLFTCTQCCQGSCVMWSAWVSKSAHAHTPRGSLLPTLLVGGFLQGAGCSHRCATILHVNTAAVLASRTHQRWSWDWKWMLRRSSVCVQLVTNARAIPCVLQCPVVSSIRENSRGHAHRLWRTKLVNSASWRATVEDTLPCLRRRLHRPRRGYWPPQVTHTPQLSHLTASTQVSVSPSQHEIWFLEKQHKSVLRDPDYSWLSLHGVWWSQQDGDCST